MNGEGYRGNFYDLRAIEVALPRLDPDSPRDCPVSSEEVVEYVMSETDDGRPASPLEAAVRPDRSDRQHASIGCGRFLIARTTRTTSVVALWPGRHAVLECDGTFGMDSRAIPGGGSLPDRSPERPQSCSGGAMTGGWDGGAPGLLIGRAGPPAIPRPLARSPAGVRITANPRWAPSGPCRFAHRPGNEQDPGEAISPTEAVHADRNTGQDRVLLRAAQAGKDAHPRGRQARDCRPGP